MKIEDVKKNLNRMVVYKDIADVYELTACIIRRGETGFYYQVELLDTIHGNSVMIGRLEDIEVQV